MATIPDLDIDVIEGPGHAGNRAALDAWAAAVREGINNPTLATSSSPGAMSAADKTTVDATAADRTAGARGIVETTTTKGVSDQSWTISSLAGDTGGPIELWFHVIHGGSLTGEMYLNINGSPTTNFAHSRVQTNTAASGAPSTVGGATPWTSGVLYANNAVPGDWSEIHVIIPNPESSQGNRIVHVEVTASIGSASQRLTYIVIRDVITSAMGEITSIGLTVDSPLTIDAASTCRSLRRIRSA